MLKRENSNCTNRKAYCYCLFFFPFVRSLADAPRRVSACLSPGPRDYVRRYRLNSFYFFLSPKLFAYYDDDDVVYTIRVVRRIESVSCSHIQYVRHSPARCRRRTHTLLFI